MYKGIRKKRGKKLKDVKLAHKLDEQKLSKSLNLNNQRLHLISQLPTILLFAPMEKKLMMLLQHF
jgi:hypothetical protein